jgi:hypothetical protein
MEATTNHTVMKIFNKYTLLAFTAFLAFACSEDPVEEENVSTGRLTGIVVEEGTNIPLENVKISTNPASSTVFTDETGNFVIEEILVEQYSVQAELDGYLAAFESAEINNGITTNVVFELRVETASNLPPTTPVLIAPADNSTNVPLETELIWSSSDPEEDDITYTIELRNDLDDEVLSFETVNDTTLALTGSSLRFGLKYFWQVAAKDDVNEEIIQSQVSAFQTTDSPANRFIFVRKIEDRNIIFSANEDGEELQLTDSNDNSFRPRRNVAANRIAYLSNNGAQTHIFTMKLDGSDKQQITSAVPVNGFKLEELDFSWTANGGRLIYANFDKLYAINSDGTGLEELYQTSDGSFISEVVINESEDLLVLKTNDVNGYNVSIFTIDLAGNLIDDVLSGVTGAAGGLDISVENDLILYWYDVSGFEVANYRQLDSRIFIYDRSIGETTDISSGKPDGTNDYDCRFSPNEAQVILTNTSNDGISVKNVVLIDSEGGGRQDLFENAEMPDFE